jgi:hypothetical protein
MEYTFEVKLNGVVIYTFKLPIPLNDDQLCEFNFEVSQTHEEQEHQAL